MSIEEEGTGVEMVAGVGVRKESEFVWIRVEKAEVSASGPTYFRVRTPDAREDNTTRRITYLRTTRECFGNAIAVTSMQ